MILREEEKIELDINKVIIHLLESGNVVFRKVESKLIQLTVGNHANHALNEIANGKTPIEALQFLITERQRKYERTLEETNKQLSDLWEAKKCSS